MKRIYIYQWRFLTGYGNSYHSDRRCALRKKLRALQQNLLSASEKVFIATANLSTRRCLAYRRSSPGTRKAGLLRHRSQGAVRGVGNDSVVIIDCCTVWIGNVWHKSSGNGDSMNAAGDLSLLSGVAARSHGAQVSNEVGWGIVPPDPQTRRYRDIIGKLNQRFAREADEVYLCVAGIAVPIKKNNGRG